MPKRSKQPPWYQNHIGLIVVGAVLIAVFTGLMYRNELASLLRAQTAGKEPLSSKTSSEIGTVWNSVVVEGRGKTADLAKQNAITNASATLNTCAGAIEKVKTKNKSDGGLSCPTGWEKNADSVTCQPVTQDQVKKDPSLQSVCPKSQQKIVGQDPVTFEFIAQATCSAACNCSVQCVAPVVPEPKPGPGGSGIKNKCQLDPKYYVSEPVQIAASSKEEAQGKFLYAPHDPVTCKAARLLANGGGLSCEDLPAGCMAMSDTQSVCDPDPLVVAAGIIKVKDVDCVEQVYLGSPKRFLCQAAICKCTLACQPS